MNGVLLVAAMMVIAIFLGAIADAVAKWVASWMRAPHEQDDTPFPWTEAAPTLGFVHENGFRRRESDRIELRLTGSSAGKHAQRVECTATFSPPLGTSFSIEPYDGGRSTEVSLDERFDQAYTVTASNRERVARLITEEAQDQLMAANELGRRVEVEPARLSVIGDWITSYDEIRQIVLIAEALAHELVESEGRLPLAKPKAAVEAAWQRVAEELEASFDPASRLLTLTRASGSLTCRLEGEGDERWCATARVRFAKPLRQPVVIVTEAALAPWDGGDDVELRDRAFDAVFSVKSTAPRQAVLDLLDDPVRASLLELGRVASQVSVMRELLTARFEAAVAVGEDELRSALEALLSASDALASTSSAAHGAYR